MVNDAKVVKVSAEVYERLSAWQKTLSEQAAKSTPGVSARMVTPTLGSIVEIAMDALDAPKSLDQGYVLDVLDASASFERFSDHFGKAYYDGYESDLDSIRRALRGR